MGNWTYQVVDGWCVVRWEKSAAKARAFAKAYAEKLKAKEGQRQG